MQLSATTVLSYRDVFNFCSDKAAADPAVAYDSHAHLKEMLHLCWTLVSIKLLFIPSRSTESLRLGPQVKPC